MNEISISPSPTERAHPWASFLGRLKKPGRYLGSEEQAVVKGHEGLACTFVLAFPDLYEVGMSHLGTRIIYDLVNKHDDLVCERAFSPWGDAEAALRERGLPLISLETYTPLREFDAVGVSLQYELSYTNALLNLELGGIPLRSVDRSDADPIVLGGGPTATHPEPLAPFVDAFLVGEAEERLPELLRLIGTMRRQGRPRAEILAKMSRLGGVYVPQLYRVQVEPKTGLQVVMGRTDAGVAAGAHERVERVFVRDLDAFPFPDRFPVPYAEAIFDRASVEITRGCTEGCRFCQAGIIYRPVRERSPKEIMKSVLGGIDNGGFDETSLTALSTADVSCVAPLIKELVPELVERKVQLGIASLRAYGLDGELLDEIKRVGINGLTFAPEAGTQRMRDVINKNVSDDDILASARRIFERGYDRMKMYFMMGLPTETEQDVMGIIETGRRVRDLAKSMGLRRLPNVTVSVSQHVPKPHTPFQWAAMDSMQDLESKSRMLRDQGRRVGLGVKTHEVQGSWLECIFARGDRRLGDVLERAYRAGARFDGWRECFDFNRWLDALESASIEPERYTQTLPVGARLPWDHIDIGLEDDFLASEYRKAVRSRSSPPCGKAKGDQVHHTTLAAAEADTRRLVCYDCGIACDMSQMRDERIVALRSLTKVTEQRVQREAEAARAAPERREDLVPLSRLAGRLPASNLDANSAFKAAAEQPHSRLRLVFGKHGTMRFLSHLDLLRILPRVFRRAGVEQAFSRGYTPVPRMSFGPALALGFAAHEEVADIDVLLPESLRDMSDELSAEQRERIAQRIVDKLASVAPPGLHIVSGRLVQPQEIRLGQLVGAADYVAQLTAEQAQRMRAGLASRLREDLIVRRASKPKRRKGKRRAPVEAHPTYTEIDVAPLLLHAEIDDADDVLRFRLRMGPQGGVRPREVAALLVGETLPDHQMTRTRLLSRRGDTWVGLRELGPVFRPSAPQTAR